MCSIEGTYSHHRCIQDLAPPHANEAPKSGHGGEILDTLYKLVVVRRCPRISTITQQCTVTLTRDGDTISTQ